MGLQPDWRLTPDDLVTMAVYGLLAEGRSVLEESKAGKEHLTSEAAMDGFGYTIAVEYTQTTSVLLSELEWAGAYWAVAVVEDPAASTLETWVGFSKEMLGRLKTDAITVRPPSRWR
jgi:hypothetical protein